MYAMTHDAHDIGTPMYIIRSMMLQTEREEVRKVGSTQEKKGEIDITITWKGLKHSPTPNPFFCTCLGILLVISTKLLAKKLNRSNSPLCP